MACIGFIRAPSLQTAPCCNLKQDWREDWVEITTAKLRAVNQNNGPEYTEGNRNMAIIFCGFAVTIIPSYFSDEAHRLQKIVSSEALSPFCLFSKSVGGYYCFTSNSLFTAFLQVHFIWFCIFWKERK